MAGQDKGMGGSQVRVDEEDRGELRSQPYDELLKLPHTRSPAELLNYLIDSGSDISL